VASPSIVDALVEDLVEHRRVLRRVRAEDIDPHERRVRGDQREHRVDQTRIGLPVGILADVVRAERDHPHVGFRLRCEQLADLAHPRPRLLTATVADLDPPPRATVDVDGLDASARARRGSRPRTPP
jgi:hypothetical protein